MKKLLQLLKNKSYFLVARYFRFFAMIHLRRWNPYVIVVTGSSGKTTLLNMLDAQLGDVAHVSHHANSAYGIPFDILGLHGIRTSRMEWIGLLLKAPLRALSVTRAEEMYVAEVDAERPGEAPFLANLLKPDTTLWVSSARTHSVHFDALVKKGKFDSVEAAVAHEYGSVVAKTKECVYIDGDARRIVAEAKLRTPQGVETIAITQKENFESYELKKDKTIFKLSSGKSYTLHQPQPKNVFYQLGFIDELLKRLEVKPDYNFSQLVFPPGRSTKLEGKHGITIIDSSYNANYASMRVIIDMFRDYPAKHKWLVIGDMVDQGEGEAEEHAKLADLLHRVQDVERIVLLGPRVREYTLPPLQKLFPKTPITAFDNPKDVLDFINEQMSGKETILFKGARFLEGVIEHLLKNPEDVKQLARREEIWQKRREKWGL